ncbi:MAG: glycosyltransferase family 4 protein [Chlorobi bacterium]|nr:glycosyltransferase family 4 protein [Chlorobiota bacterium]
MKIGFDAKRAFYNRSGLGNYSRHTISILSEFVPENQYFLYTPSKRNAINFTTQSNVHIKFPQGINKLLKKSWRSYGVIKDLQKDRISVYHGLSNELPFNIKRSAIPSVVTIHDLIFLRYPEFYYKHDRKIYTKKFSKSCINADRIIAISEQTKSDIINFFNIDENKIDVVYQGSNPLFTKKLTGEELMNIKQKYNLPNQFILNVGTIEKRKNIFSVVKALFNENIEIPLVVVGKKTAYINSIQKFIDENKMQNRVLFFDKVPFKDLPAIYQLASVFVYPSLFEGFGIPILEAMHSGIPVITNKDGCFREAAGKNSLFVDPENTEEIGFAIRKILSDNELYEKTIIEGKKHIEKFSEKRIADNLIRVYKKIGH